jgi:hypothetical protein
MEYQITNHQLADCNDVGGQLVKRRSSAHEKGYVKLDQLNLKEWDFGY